MADKRSRNPKAIKVLNAQHTARLRRVVKKIEQGKIVIGDVTEDLRGFARDELAQRARGRKA